MSFGQFTKQLAQQAIGNQVKDVIDALRPSDAAARADALATAAPVAAGAGENLAAVVIGQIQAMQNVLKEDQELVVLCTAGLETMRVLEVFTPVPKLMVLTGIDSERNMTRVIAAVDTLQLVCKPMAVQEGAKPARIRVIIPKPKPE